MGNQFLSLSLFMMLLSFFIILNAMSTFEEVRSRPVLNSLALAFSKADAPKDSEPNTQEDAAESFHEGDSLDKIQALFQSRIAGVEISKNRLGTVMHVRLPIERFERAVFARTGPDDGGREVYGIGGGASTPGFSPMLVSLMDTADSIPYRMDMVMNIDNPADSFSEQPPGALKREIEHVALYAQKLEEDGLPRKYITAGLGRGKKGTIDLFFHRYEPINPFGDRPVAGSEGDSPEEQQQ